jgi:Icc-related predicted phosphoesterase
MENKKIVMVSDTHNKHNQIVLPEGNILVHSGDFSGMGKQSEVKSFFKWITKQSEIFEHIIFIAGNHELSFEDKASWVDELIEGLPKNVHYLEDSEVVIDGIKFYGTPYQPEFYNWAFNLKRGVECAEKWTLIPEDTDVLLSHGGPKYMCDYMPWDLINIGCQDLLDRIMVVRPKLNVFGHIHCGYGYKEYEGILFVNASTCNEVYEPVNKPIVVEYKDGKFEFTE